MIDNMAYYNITKHWVMNQMLVCPEYLVTQASCAQNTTEKHILGGLMLQPHLQNRRHWAGLAFVQGSIYHKSPVLFDNC